MLFKFTTNIQKSTDSWVLNQVQSIANKSKIIQLKQHRKKICTYLNSYLNFCEPARPQEFKRTFSCMERLQI